VLLRIQKEGGQVVMSGPLDGLRVLELTRNAPSPGAYCAMMLSDLGADVIRILPAGGRSAEAVFVMPPEKEEEARAYDPLARNRRAAMLNLRLQDAREVFYRLVEEADVVTEGFRPGVTERMGVDYDTVRQKNPRIIYCSLTGYGQTGAYKDMVGHDINYISVAGALGIVREAGRKPIPPSNILADFAGGAMQAAIGILSAVIARERTGKGQYLDVAMVDGVIGLMNFAVANQLQSGGQGAGGADVFCGTMPHYSTYETKDGKFISVGALEPAFFANLCRAIGRDDLIALEWRMDKWDELSAGFAETFLTKNRDEWWGILQQFETCAAPVLDVDEVFNDPHVKERDMLVELGHPKLGKVKQVGIPFKFSDTPCKVRSFAPAPGQHTDEILLEAGYSQQQINALRESGAIA
jgi:crotonobetainyl-CoA:carnitine CoA-transferase CaiB-like acyl-CoA transferase